jgi:hypothetical protein
VMATAARQYGGNRGSAYEAPLRRLAYSF